MKEKLKNFAWGYVILFAVLTAIGILCISFHNTLPYVALGIGIIITLFGIIYGVLALASKERGAKFAFKVTIAVCSIIAGVITMVFCKKAVDILTALMGLFLIIDGSFKLQSAAISKRYKSVGWWLLLVPSLISIIGGFLITRYESAGTDESVSFISIALGIVLIIDAISNLLTAFLAGKLLAASPDNAKAAVADTPALTEATEGGEKSDSAEGDAEADADAPREDKPEAEDDAPTDIKVEAEDTPTEEKPEAEGDAPTEEKPEADTDALTEDKPEADAEAPREDKPEADGGTDEDKK